MGTAATFSEKTIREIALEQPSSVRVFERFGIDYCCGGRMSLEEACKKLHLSPEQVRTKLEEALSHPADDSLSRWNNAPLHELTKHIVTSHHAFVLQELPRVMALATKVAGKHGEKHMELQVIHSLFGRVYEEMMSHMAKEEQILFPYIDAMSTGRISDACFRDVTDPISVMIAEHETVGELLAKIRDLSDEFHAPEGACPSYHALYAGLHDFEKDLHRHVHLENNVLFPRAIEMEKTVRK